MNTERVLTSFLAESGSANISWIVIIVDYYYNYIYHHCCQKDIVWMGYNGQQSWRLSKFLQHWITRNISISPGWDASPSRGYPPALSSLVLTRRPKRREALFLLKNTPESLHSDSSALTIRMLYLLQFINSRTRKHFAPILQKCNPVIYTCLKNTKMKPKILDSYISERFRAV